MKKILKCLDVTLEENDSLLKHEHGKRTTVLYIADCLELKSRSQKASLRRTLNTMLDYGLLEKTFEVLPDSFGDGLPQRQYTWHKKGFIEHDKKWIKDNRRKTSAEDFAKLFSR